MCDGCSDFDHVTTIGEPCVCVEGQGEGEEGKRAFVRLSGEREGKS